MIESNNEKNVYEKLSEYEKCFDKKSGNWDKSIKSKIRDFPGKLGHLEYLG